MPRRATPLTAVRIRQATAPDYPLWDGDGLYLELAKSGERLWRLKYYRPDGRENRISLGNLREVTLAQAREARTKARALLREGLDPSLVRRERKAEARRQSAASFEAVARDWLAKRKPHWAEQTHRKAVYVVESYLIPRLRRTSIATLSSHDANAALEKVTAAAPSLGRKARQYLAQIEAEAIHAGLRPEGARLLLRTQPRTRQAKGHIPAATRIKDVRQVVRAIASYQGSPVVQAALKLTMYTAMRPGIVASARWEDIDLAAAEWHVPGERMKTGHDHLVSLPRQALVVLDLMQSVGGTGEYVFPAQARQKTPHLHRDTLSSALRRQGLQGKHAPHGFRGMLRTVARERLGVDPDVLEAQLAHAKRGEVQQAYDHTRFVEKRREVMQAWADYLDSLLA